MKNILIILKKELTRFFKDTRLLIMILLPGVLIYGIYSMMGGMISNLDPSDATFLIDMANQQQEIVELLQTEEFAFNAEYTYFDANEGQEAHDARLQKLKDGEIDLVIIFEENFVADSFEQGKKPSVQIYYNPYETNSSYAYAKVIAALDIFRAVALDSFGYDLQVFIFESKEIYNADAAGTQMITMMLPFLLMSLLFSGCAGVAPDSIAGEKERGTIATILIAPIKRSHLALGKIMAISIIASLSALSSFLGVLSALPKLMVGVEISVAYGVGEYILLLLVLVSTVLLIVGVLSVLSSLAKSVKEAGMLIMPVMILSMLVGASSFIGATSTSAFLFLIPLYNSVQSMIAILSFSINPLNLALAICSNLLYVAGCVFLLTKMFNSERIMFNK